MFAIFNIDLIKKKYAVFIENLMFFFTISYFVYLMTYLPFFT